MKKTILAALMLATSGFAFGQSAEVLDSQNVYLISVSGDSVTFTQPGNRFYNVPRVDITLHGSEAQRCLTLFTYIDSVKSSRTGARFTVTEQGCDVQTKSIPL